MVRARVPDSTVARCLGHAVEGLRITRAHYIKADYTPEKRTALEALAAEIDRILRQG